MKRWNFVLLLVVCCALTATAGQKDKGATSLKDLKTVGSPDKKNKNQEFDFVFEASGRHYVCRTSQKTKLKATDYVVGENLKYEIDGNKGKLKNPAGKEVKCTVVRVEAIGAATAQ